jgi:hypothetical protein
MEDLHQRKSANRVGIFISHKLEDAALAKQLKTVLASLAKGRLAVYISEEIHPGDPWEEEIRTKLRASQIFLLLYTNPEYDWGWCLYEAGLFSPLEAGRGRRLICLFPADGDPPRQLQNLQGVRARKKELMENFLHPLCRHTTLTGMSSPLNAKITDDELERKAEEIASLIVSTRTQPRYYNESFIVNVSKESMQLNAASPREAIPNSALIEATSGCKTILNVDDETFSWETLRELAEKDRGKGTFWVDEIGQVMCDVARRIPPKLMTSTFREPRGGKIYRPIFHQADRKNGEPFRYYFLFHEELAPELVRGPDRVGELFSLLRLGNRIRWEVAEPYIKT